MAHHHRHFEEAYAARFRRHEYCLDCLPVPQSDEEVEVLYVADEQPYTPVCIICSHVHLVYLLSPGRDMKKTIKGDGYPALSEGTFATESPCTSVAKK